MGPVGIVLALESIRAREKEREKRTGSRGQRAFLAVCIRTCIVFIRTYVHIHTYVVYVYSMCKLY